MSFFNGGSISNRSNLISKIENPTDPSNLKHKSTMTLAEKKRIQWQKERGILKYFYLNYIQYLKNF